MLPFIFVLLATSAAQAATESHLLICAPNSGTILARLLPRDAEAKARTIHFLETPEARLFSQGIILRVRETEGKSKRSLTLKILGARATPPDSEDAKCEADFYGDTLIRSCSVDAKVSREEPLALSRGQEEFLRLARPGIALPAKLEALGPIEATGWEFEHAGFPFSLELWRVPARGGGGLSLRGGGGFGGRDGLHNGAPGEPRASERRLELIELSVRTEPAETTQGRAAMQSLLRERALTPCTDQGQKTRAAILALTGSVR
ncbi:MAG: hypothetical protein NDJ89_04225 [Oligoflexia bacterium]|nr:hypothetical protein [Oligoflexia bacterium]